MNFFYLVQPEFITHLPTAICHLNEYEKSMFRLQGEISLFSFALADITTRSLTGVYAESNEVFEMTCCVGSR